MHSGVRSVTRYHSWQGLYHGLGLLRNWWWTAVFFFLAISDFPSCNHWWAIPRCLTGFTQRSVRKHIPNIENLPILLLKGIWGFLKMVGSTIYLCIYGISGNTPETVCLLILYIWIFLWITMGSILRLSAENVLSAWLSWPTYQLISFDSFYSQCGERGNLGEREEQTISWAKQVNSEAVHSWSWSQVIGDHYQQLVIIIMLLLFSGLHEMRISNEVIL